MGKSATAVDYATYYPSARAINSVNRGREREPLFVDAEEARTLSTRGSFLPYVVGRRRIGPVIAWVGDRTFVAPPATRAGGKGGGGGGGGGSSTLIAENGWHLICVGPAKCLHRIWISGKIVFEGPIDSTTMPSGSSVSVPDVGTFTIYWGESTQPVNVDLGDPTRVGIASRWPYHCYVYWELFSLGSQPNWPVVDYDIETEIQFTTLTQTSPSAETTPGPGVNAAHAISQALFAPFPHGLNKPQSLFDMASLEAVALKLSNPSPGFLPTPINAELVANWDAADPSQLSVDGSGFVLSWTDGFLSKVLNGPGTATKRPVYYDGQNVPPGLATWPSNPGILNACPGVYFYADFLTHLENGGILTPSTGYGFISTVTIYPARINVGRFGVVNGFYDGLSPAGVPGAGAPIPPSPDMFTLQAGSEEQVGPDFINYFAHVVDTALGNASAGFAATPFTPVTLVVAAKFTQFPAEVSLTVSVVNGGLPVTVAIPFAFPASPNTFIMGGVHALSTLGEYFLDGIVHQTVLLRNNVQQSDIDLYVQWMKQRWASCGGSPDSRPYSTNALAASGKQAGQYLAEILRDASIALRWNTVKGQFQFVALRANADVILVPDGYRAGPPPQIESLLLDTDPDKIVFSFVDVDHGFQKQTITIDDDGRADLETFAKPKEVNFPTVVDFDSAEAVAARRIMEELSLKSKIKLELNHEGRLYYPGEVLSVPTVPFLVRVIDLKFDKGSNASLEAIPDIYGVAEFFYFQAPTGTGDETGQPIDPLPDPFFGLFELPECLAPTPNTIFAIVPRIRANGQMAFANIHLSPDNVTYINEGAETNFQTGGTLDAPIAATDPYIGPVGASAPTITIAGPDGASVPEDLSASPVLWRGGRQLCLIGDEIFFLQALTPVGGLTYRLDGLIRARYDTSREAHAPGAEVYVFIEDEISVFSDALILQPLVTAWAKAQPVASSALSLASITPDSRLLYGKNVRPEPPAVLRFPTYWSPVYCTTEDVPMSWDYRVCVTGTGAGYPPAGTPHGTPPPVGDFVLEILDGALLVVRTEILAAPSYTYTNANLVADLGAELDFTVRIFARRSGLLSDPITQLVELLP